MTDEFWAQTKLREKLAKCRRPERDSEWMWEESDPPSQGLMSAVQLHPCFIVTRNCITNMAGLVYSKTCS